MFSQGSGGSSPLIRTIFRVKLHSALLDFYLSVHCKNTNLHEAVASFLPIVFGHARTNVARSLFLPNRSCKLPAMKTCSLVVLPLLSTVAFAQNAQNEIDAHLTAARNAAGFDFTGTLARLCVAPG